MSDTPKLSAAARQALRRTLTNHSGWTSAFRNKHGFSLASMSVADYVNASRLLNIDLAAISRAADAAKLEEAKRTFDTVAIADEFESEIAAAVEDEAPPRFVDKRSETQRNRDAVDQDMKDRAREARSIFSSAKEAAPMSETGAAARLAQLISELTAAPTLDEEAVRAIVKREVDLALADNVSVVRIELTDNGIAMPRVDGHKHPEFAKLLRCATAKDASGFTPNIWLAGPAGSGKTFAVGQVARALGLEFHYNGAIGMSHELLGFVDAGGTYHRTAFREAYENGGCYLFDEVDGSDNAALLALNAALANGSATFPDKTVKRHPDCKIFAAANTWGMGATADYVGRSKLDAAFLSRFPVRIVWNYDEDLEQAICGNPEFARMVQRARRAAKECGLKVLITPRDSMAGAALVAAGFSLLDAAEMSYLANLSTDQRTMLERKLIGA